MVGNFTKISQNLSLEVQSWKSANLIAYLFSIPARLGKNGSTPISIALFWLHFSTFTRSWIRPINCKQEASQIRTVHVHLSKGQGVPSFITRLHEVTLNFSRIRDFHVNVLTFRSYVLCRGVFPSCPLPPTNIVKMFSIKEAKAT